MCVSDYDPSIMDCCFSQFGADFYCIVHTGDMDCCDTGVLGRLSQEKHFERQLRGRRQSSLGPVVNQPVTDPGQPRQPSADWRIPGVCELLRQHNVHLLEVIILSFFATTHFFLTVFRFHVVADLDPVSLRFREHVKVGVPYRICL